MKKSWSYNPHGSSSNQTVDHNDLQISFEGDYISIQFDEGYRKFLSIPRANEISDFILNQCLGGGPVAYEKPRENHDEQIRAALLALGQGSVTHATQILRGILNE